jgi:hypothetical protein
VISSGRRAREHIRRLTRTGLPEILSVNGRAELVVQDAASYRKLLEPYLRFLEDPSS